jgi:alkanesulfonate monooxygenase SsuD/methylene tetrahydromethanopterin reductase-like flavin-dependent oxidoreductase (luciferase family)
VKTALRYLEDEPPSGGRRWLVGAPQTVRAGVDALLAEYGADELMAVTITFDHDERKRSYELLAELAR